MKTETIDTKITDLVEKIQVTLQNLQKCSDEYAAILRDEQRRKRRGNYQG